MFLHIFTFLILAVTLSHGQSDCASGYTCIPIRDCPEARTLARLVKNTKDESKKLDVLAKIREKLCGERKDYSVCCDTSTVEGLEEQVQDIAPASGSPCDTLPEIGTFKQLTFHPVSGRVVAKDEKTILICDFVYDGQGPDAFLIVGNRQASATPNSRDAIPILPPNKSSPSIKRKLNFKDKDIPILNEFKGQTLELSVPEGETTDSLKWISIFCRDYDIDFGHATLTHNQDLPKRS